MKFYAVENLKEAANGKMDILLNSIKRHRTMESLCWKCSNSGAECPWLDNFTPVPGWKAVRSDYRLWRPDGVIVLDTYRVIKCPLFRRIEHDGKGLK